MATRRVAHALPPIGRSGARRVALGGWSSSPLSLAGTSSTSTRLAASPLVRSSGAIPAVAATQEVRFFHAYTRTAAAAAAPAAARPAKARFPVNNSNNSSSTTAGARPTPSSSAENVASAGAAVDAAVDADTVDAVIPEAPTTNLPATDPIDWSSSFHGLSTTPFPREAAAILSAPIDPQDIEIKPDGIIYLPEIKYRRILSAAFGPGGWGLAPRGALRVGEKVVSREYALVVHGRFVAEARGECAYFGGEDGVATAGEGCKSNALMRCCKDLGVASELWDPRFIRTFKQAHGREVWVEHVATKKRRRIWLRKDCPPVYPYASVSGGGGQ
ncbi:mitochondrial genome maintenance protein mgm101 [Niveomyces insectorum RCEF 264]|uniref:Mitochondrial genome maintenance protein MGM101 n=1 Tax=Niveomyces insectorum RCEF 264 TaxID=1081102 RepID=A0A162I8S7_9HYPO|nr:mitochondrial genome maintenance protein mgm101 [Niveomyces insectorum RCEF 264]